MSFFTKLASGASNFFHKATNDTKSFFHKATNTVEHTFNHTIAPGIKNTMNKIGSGIKTAGNKLSGVGMKAGNFLEKNSGIISDVAAGGLYATGFGAPIATAVLAAGNTAQQIGARLKDGSSQLRDASNMAGGVLKAHGNLFNKHITDVANNVKQQYNQNLNDVQASNNLAKIHATLDNFKNKLV